MQENINNKYFILADIFLIVLEQMAQDEGKRTYIKKIRTLMDVPECAALHLILRGHDGCRDG